MCVYIYLLKVLISKLDYSILRIGLNYIYQFFKLNLGYFLLGILVQAGLGQEFEKYVTVKAHETVFNECLIIKL